MPTRESAPVTSIPQVAPALLPTRFLLGLLTLLGRTGVWSRLTVGAAELRRRARAAGADRGDVPGWVLVTVMSAGLVTALWLVAGPKLAEILSTALDGVSGGP
jgi:hypothetical protein